MIAQLQAITVDSGLSDLPARLQGVSLDSLILPRPTPLNEMVQVAEWPEQRTQLLADGALRVQELRYSGTLRQRGAFSSGDAIDGVGSMVNE